MTQKELDAFVARHLPHGSCLRFAAVEPPYRNSLFDLLEIAPALDVLPVDPIPCWRLPRRKWVAFVPLDLLEGITFLWHFVAGGRAVVDLTTFLQMRASQEPEH